MSNLGWDVSSQKRVRIKAPCEGLERDRDTRGVTGTSSSRGRAGQLWNCAEPSRDGEPATQPRRPTGCHPEPRSLRKWPRCERARERQATETERHRQAGRKSDRDSDGPGGRG